PSPQAHRCFSLPGSGRCPMTLWATSAPTVVLSATPSADRSISSSFSTRSSARFKRVCHTSLSVITSTATTTTIAGPDRSASDAACSHSSIRPPSRASSCAPAGDGRHALLRRPPGIAERQARGVVVVVPLHRGQPDHVAGAGDLHQRTRLDLPRFDPATALVVEDPTPHERGAAGRLVVEVAQRLGADLGGVLRR